METTYTLPAPDDADAIDSDDLEELLFHVGAILAARSDVDALTRCAFDVAYCSYTSDMDAAIYALQDSIDNLRDALNGYR